MTAAEQRKKKAQQMADYYAARGDSTSAGAKAAQRAVSKAEGKTPYSASGAAVQKYRANKPTTVQDIYANRPTRQNNQTQAPNPALAQSIVNTVLGTGRRRSAIAGVDNAIRSGPANPALAQKIVERVSNQQIRIQPGAASAASTRQQMEAAQTKEPTVIELSREDLAERNRKARQAGFEALKNSDIGTTLRNVAQNPVMWASDTFGSAVDSAASGVASTAATLTDFGANVNEFTRTGNPEWQREQAVKMRNAANANAQSAAQYRQSAIETAGNTDFGAFATDLGVAGAQMYIDALTGGLLKTGTMAPMMVRSFGYGAQEAADAGFGANGQVLNGIKSAGVEYLSEKLFGGNPVYDADAGLVNKLLGRVLDENSQLIKVLASKPADIVYEGLEEVVSDLLNPLIDQGALWVTGDDRIQVDWPKAEELLKDFAIGSAMSAASNLATGQLSGTEAAQQQTVNQTQNAPVQQAAQEAAQQAPQPTEAGTAPNAENAPGGVFNTAQDAQETKPTQTVADIYAKRATRQQNIDNAAQAGYTNNSIDSVSGGVADDTGRSAETNRDGVSEVHQDSHGDDKGQRGLGGVSRDFGFILSDQAKSAIQASGVVFAETRDVTANSAAFSVALDEARASDAKNGWAVSPKAQQEIDENGIRVFMDENGSIGFGIAPDGDIEAVFANKQKGAPSHSADSIIPQAIAAGGTKLDCYGAGLVRIYSQYGFVPVARVAFNPEYANDGWDASKGTPYIYFMMATDTDADSVVANSGQYKVWTQAELDALPLMEYDEAYAYRDSLLAQRQGEVAGNKNVTPQRPSDQLFRTGLSSEAYADTHVSNDSVTQESQPVKPITLEESIENFNRMSDEFGERLQQIQEESRTREIREDEVKWLEERGNWLNEEKQRIVGLQRQAQGLTSKNRGTAENHIDNRNWDAMRKPSIKSFQFDHPELHKYYAQMAEQLRDTVGFDNAAFTAVYNDWRHLSTEEKKKYTEGVEGEFDGIDTLKKLNSCLNSGLSTEQFYKAKNAHDEIDDLGLNASEKRARFANWLDRESRFTTAEKRTALSNFPYTTTLVADEGNYEKMTEAGVSKNGSLALFNTMQKLKPAEGYTDVAGWQKYEAITSSGLTDEEQLAALSVYATDSAYDYYQAAYDCGVSPSRWSDVLANIRGYEGQTKSNGKDTYSANVSQESLCRAMFDAGLSDAQAEAMY